MGTTGTNCTNVMSRALNVKLLRKLSLLFRPKKNTTNLTVNSFRTYFSKTGKLFIGSQVFNEALRNDTINKIDVDDGLRKACEEGNAAVIRLMDQLREFVTIVSREYRCCIIKQIEITQTASSIGPFADAWDELPKYRTLADELNKELTDYMTLFKTIGHMAHEESLIQFMKDGTDNLHSVNARYKELEVAVQKEFDENKKFEGELLRIKRDSILNDITK